MRGLLRLRREPDDSRSPPSRVGRPTRGCSYRESPLTRDSSYRKSPGGPAQKRYTDEPAVPLLRPMPLTPPSTWVRPWMPPRYSRPGLDLPPKP